MPVESKPRKQDSDPSGRSKPTISSLLLAPFSPTSENPTTNTKKKNNFSTFRGLGCTASSQVSVPAVIRTSADWDSNKRVKKKKQQPNVKSNNNNSSSCVPVPADVWCAPGIGLSTDAADVDCVVSTRPSRGPREAQRYACPVRRMVSPEENPFLDIESSISAPRSRVELFASRLHRHSRHGYPEGLAEIMMLQNSLMGGRTDGVDRYRGLRLDVDNMSYEELLELGDRIGHVNTGLAEDEITRCVRRTKPFFLNNLSHILTELEKKCSICQEEYEADDEMGKLDCGHFYHTLCIKQWLMQKNSCPVCKSTAMSNN